MIVGGRHALADIAVALLKSELPPVTDFLYRSFDGEQMMLPWNAVRQCSSHRTAPLPPCENRLREQRRFKGNLRILLQPPRVHPFLDCFRRGLARVDSRSARLRSFLNCRYGRTAAIPRF